MTWYPETHWKSVEQLRQDAERRRRTQLEQGVDWCRARIKRLMELRDYEKAARIRTRMREDVAELRRMDGLCGECGRPREKRAGGIR